MQHLPYPYPYRRNRRDRHRLTPWTMVGTGLVATGVGMTLLLLVATWIWSRLVAPPAGVTFALTAAGASPPAAPAPTPVAGPAPTPSGGKAGIPAVGPAAAPPSPENVSQGAADTSPAPARRGPAPRPVTVGLQQPTIAGSLWGARSAAPIHLLLLGLDQDRFRSDIVLLVRLEPNTRRVALLSIPRDTLTAIAEPGDTYPRWDKMAHASAYRDRVLPGFERARRTVEDLLGVRVHRYVAVNLEAFVTVVDAIGGVTFNVPRDMRYQDPYQNLNIDLQAGEQRLIGEQAMGLIRWRHDNEGYGYGDLGRIQTQRAFLTATLEQVKQPTALARLLPQVPTLLGMVSTDLSLPEATALAATMTRLPNPLPWYTLPGHGGDPDSPEFGYYIADEAALPQTVTAWSGAAAGR